MDETKQKIINATMALVKDKGYVATTTKDIAHLARVNECTIFRKFRNKKEIILCAMEQETWRANVTPSIFENITWDLQSDIEMFMFRYLERITDDFVRLSIGLRAPQISDETLPLIMKVPETFIRALTSYLEQMHKLGKIKEQNYACLALTIFSATFGFTFLKASFADELSPVDRQTYIQTSVALFVNGIQA